jgi:endonuclease YncB( thermonuclease family)
MLELKPQQEFESDNRSNKWNIGVDRRHVAAFVALALLLGFGLGYAISQFNAPPESDPDRDLVTSLEASPSAENRNPPSSLGSDSTEFQNVTRIVRADTLEVEGVGVVQMIGIETPDGKAPTEIYGVHGQRALEYVQKTLLGQPVRLESDSAVASSNADVQKMAYVFTRDGQLFNAEMIKEGHALVRVADNFRLVDQFRLLEADAMRGMRGIWGFGGGTSLSSSKPPTTASQPPPSSTSPTAGDRPRRLTPLSPSELGPNVPAVSDPGAAASNSTEPLVWISTSDRTYHKSGCDYLGKKRQALSASQARADGYASCSRCFASTVLKAR